MSFEHLHEIARNSLKQQNLQKIKSNASNLDDVLTFRVNSALRKNSVRFVRIISLLQVLNLNVICSKLLSKVLYNFKRPMVWCELNYWANLTI